MKKSIVILSMVISLLISVNVNINAYSLNEEEHFLALNYNKGGYNILWYANGGMAIKDLQSGSFDISNEDIKVQNLSGFIPVRGMVQTINASAEGKIIHNEGDWVAARFYIWDYEIGARYKIVADIAGKDANTLYYAPVYDKNNYCIGDVGIKKTERGNLLISIASVEEFMGVKVEQRKKGMEYKFVEKNSYSQNIAQSNLYNYLYSGEIFNTKTNKSLIYMAQNGLYGEPYKIWGQEDKYDFLITGWINYWNNKWGTIYHPDVIKAMMANESVYGIGTGFNTKNDVMQVMNHFDPNLYYFAKNEMAFNKAKSEQSRSDQSWWGNYYPLYGQGIIPDEGFGAVRNLINSEKLNDNYEIKDAVISSGITPVLSISMGILNLHLKVKSYNPQNYEQLLKAYNVGSSDYIVNANKELSKYTGKTLLDYNF